MKKILGIMVLSLLLSNNIFEKASAEESCYDFIKETVQYNISNTVLQFDFKNTSRKTIKIYSWGLLRKDGSTLKKGSYPIYLKSKDSTISQLRVNDLNLNVAGNYEYYCKFEKEPKVKKKKYKSNKSKGGFQWWYLLFIPGALVLFGAISEHNNPSKEQSKPKKKKNTETHLGIKKGSTEGKTIGIIIMVVFWGIVIFAILKSNNF
jgi:hypothetical protein